MAMTAEERAELGALRDERYQLLGKSYSAAEDVAAAELRVTEIDARMKELLSQVGTVGTAATAAVRLDFILEQRSQIGKYYDDAVISIHEATEKRIRCAQEIDVIERRMRAREAAIWLDPEHPALAKLPKRTDEMVKQAIIMHRETDPVFVEDQAALTKARQERDEYDVAIRTCELSVSRGKRDMDFLTALLRFAE